MRPEKRLSLAALISTKNFRYVNSGLKLTSTLKFMISPVRNGVTTLLFDIGLRSVFGALEDNHLDSRQKPTKTTYSDNALGIV